MVKFKKSHTKFILDHETKEGMKKYCNEKLGTINKEFLSENKIYENELLEYFFAFCKKAYEETGGYNLTQEDISFLVFSKRQIDSITEELKKDHVYFWGIDSEDEMIFHFFEEKKRLEYNKGAF
jgi:hypothetical protein